MKKILAISASLFLVIVAADAQTEKQKPPPPPPKPKEEVKFTPPKIVKEEAKVSPPKDVSEKVKVKEPPPPPPKPKEEIKYSRVDGKGKTKEPPRIIEEKRDKGEPPVITVTGKMADEFYQKNPTVSEISRKGNFITVKKKDGTSEIYDMSKKDADKSFTDQYGRSPIPPPPPPKVDISKFKPPKPKTKS